MPKEKKQNNFAVFVIFLIAVFVIYYYLSQSPTSVSFTGEAARGLVSCSETDRGDLPTAKGVTTYIYKDKRLVREDFCNTPYNLTEYFCYKNQLQVHPYTCRCSQGACY